MLTNYTTWKCVDFSIQVSSLYTMCTDQEQEQVAFDVRFQTYFKNNRGISVVRDQYSYGSREGLFEIAVLGATLDLRGNKDWVLDYTTPISRGCGDCVVGYLSWSDVLEWMSKIQQLPKRNYSDPTKNDSDDEDE
jgi:hypothetical protein